jgi:hypothetical protein
LAGVGLLALAAVGVLAIASLPYLPLVHGTTAGEVERLATWLFALLHRLVIADELENVALRIVYVD